MIPRYSTKQFTFDATTGEFLAEASELTGGDVARPLFGQVFSDSADEGLILVSAKTGHPIVFYVSMTKRNADNDVLWWSLSMAPESKRQNPSVCVTVKIFND